MARCTMCQASYERGCRCSVCTSAHRSFMNSQRRKGIYRVSQHARNSSETTQPKRERFQKDLELRNNPDCLTRNDIMIARGYSTEKKEK